MAMSKKSGFSLIELIIVLVVVGIISSFALIGSNKSAQRNQLKIVADQIANAIRYAKIISLAYDGRLVLKPLSDNDWSKGMILFKDAEDHKYTRNDQLVHQWQWKKSSIQVVWHGFLSSTYLLFSPELKHSALSGNFQIIGDKTVTISINRLGHIRIEEIS